jgi:hypothetical protein
MNVTPSAPEPRLGATACGGEHGDLRRQPIPVLMYGNHPPIVDVGSGPDILYLLRPKGSCGGCTAEDSRGWGLGG